MNQLDILLFFALEILVYDAFYDFLFLSYFYGCTLKLFYVELLSLVSLKKQFTGYATLL
jgi:hypothetical protein